MADWEFAPFPTPLIDAVRGEVARITRSVVAAVGAESTIYGAVLEAPEGVGIRLGIEQAVSAFFDGAELGEHPAAGAGELWRRLGESEYQAGRELELLRSAFRIGSRALWREAAHVAAGVDVPSTVVVSLAEAIAVYTDELAADVIEGYLRAQSDEAGEMTRRRSRVAALLMDPGGVELAGLGRAAALARWTVPRELSVLAVAGPSLTAITHRLDPDVLVSSDGLGVFVVIPDPGGPGRRTMIERAVADQTCALGPAVGVRHALRSLRWSRWLLDLAVRGQVPVVGPGGVLAAEDHLVDLIVRRDEDLADALVRSALGPLEDLAPAERDRLVETLTAWLAFQRHTPQVADALHVHPQTVRYRIGKLREVLGPTLDTPGGRFELELALRLRRPTSPSAA